MISLFQNLNCVKKKHIIFHIKVKSDNSKSEILLITDNLCNIRILI